MISEAPARRGPVDAALQPTLEIVYSCIDRHHPTTTVPLPVISTAGRNLSSFIFPPHPPKLKSAQTEKPGRRWLAFVLYPARSAEKPATLELIRLIASSKPQTLALARELVGRRDEMGPGGMDFIETILVYKLPNLSRQEIIAMLALNDIELKQTRFYQEIAEEENEKGRQEGRQQESQRLVSRMMRHKFGAHAELQEAKQKLSTLSVEQLEELAEALMDFSESPEIKDWLANKLT